MKRFQLWPVLILVVALAGGGGWAWWNYDLRWRPKTITRHQDEIARIRGHQDTAGHHFRPRLHNVDFVVREAACSRIGPDISDCSRPVIIKIADVSQRILCGADPARFLQPFHTDFAGFPETSAGTICFPVYHHGKAPRGPLRRQIIDSEDTGVAMLLRIFSQSVVR